MTFKTLTSVVVVLGGGILLAACTTKTTSTADAVSVPSPYGDAPGDVWSGYKTSLKSTQAMQDDDFENPAMTYVDAAAELYNKRVGKANKSCADCHGAPNDPKGGSLGIPMIGVGAKYPVYDAQTKKPINIELRVNRCRTKYQKAKAFKYESDDMLGMTMLVAMQSRGMARTTTADNPNNKLHAAWLAGEKFYYQRRGQLDMSCKSCHEDNAGKYIRADLLSQGQSNGFPTYRLKWQKPGSLHRRFRGCNKNVRAQPYGYGSDAYLNLETYLAWRGRGLKVETPSVRK